MTGDGERKRIQPADSDPSRRIIARLSRLVQREKARVEALNRWSKALRVFALAAGLTAAGVLLYGALNFPDAPIRATDSGFEGKAGKPHTQAEYQSFKSWERLLLGSFGLAFLCGVAIAVDEKAIRRRRQSRQSRTSPTSPNGSIDGNRS